MKPMLTRFLVGVCLSAGLLQANEVSEKALDVLKKNCFACHGAAMQMSKLDLRTRAGILRGGERGSAVEPFNFNSSRLYRYVAHLENPSMPPGSKLPQDDIEALRKWILAGAPMDEVASSGEGEAKAAMKALEERPITAEERAYWAFQKPVRRDPPAAAIDEWNSNAIDRFLFATFKEKGLQPSPKADRRTLIRRVYLDLTGLPPTPEEAAAFVADKSADAWEKIVDRLLDSPHYGERWGRHWLDLVHYADSGGYERDFDWPTMWRYRDYVVDAFNNDKPYDRFIREQIAGDEKDPDSKEANIATGYLRMVLDNNIKDERTRLDELDDNVSTTSLTFLGMTVGCARCHNHKFDPIPQKDYYRMQAVFFSTREIDYPLVSGEEVKAYEAANDAIDAKQAPLKDKIKAIEQPHKDKIFAGKLAELPDYMQQAWHTPADKRTEGQRLNARQIEKTLVIQTAEILPIMSQGGIAAREKLEGEIKALNKQRPPKYPTARTITEEGPEPLPSYFLHRGDPGSKGSLLDPGVLTVAADGKVSFGPPPPTAQTTWRRTAFANWIASEDNPLTTRVMVNRIWQHHFGEGIVPTPSNFGKTGLPPSHPELLDWLATEFVQNGWSIKHMHRLMLNSRAYQMASDDIEANLKIDGANRYFWRMPRQRLEAEILRDQILAVAGTLDPEAGGPAVRPYINPDLFQSSTDRTWPGKPIGDRATWRRGIYVFSKRSIRYPMFEAFDQPDMVQSCAQRNQSTVAPQALLLMNNDEIMLQARFFAQRLIAEAGPEIGARVDRAFELALARAPSEKERKQAIEFIEGSPYGLVDFCQTIFNLNEFVYRQ